MITISKNNLNIIEFVEVVMFLNVAILDGLIFNFIESFTITAVIRSIR